MGGWGRGVLGFECGVVVVLGQAEGAMVVCVYILLLLYLGSVT